MWTSQGWRRGSPAHLFSTVHGCSGVTEAAGPTLLQSTRTGDHARMASPGMGTHPIRKRGPGRNATVERRNLLMVCRWELNTGRSGGGTSGLWWCWSVMASVLHRICRGKKIWTRCKEIAVSVLIWYFVMLLISNQRHTDPTSISTFITSLSTLLISSRKQPNL